MLSRFHLIPERDGQTDRQTDRQNCYISIARQYVSVLTRDKNKEKSVDTIERLKAFSVEKFTLDGRK